MHKRSTTALLVLAILLALTQVYAAQTNGQSDLDQHNLGSDVLTGTLGQCDPGKPAGGDSAQQAGFWQGEGDALTSIVLGSFSAKVDGAAVRIRWQTTSEVNLLGFHLHRAETPTGPQTRITGTLIPGEGQDSQGANYEWLDETVMPWQVYVYWLEAADAGGSSTFYGPVVALPPCKWQILLPVMWRQHPGPDQS